MAAVVLRLSRFVAGNPYQNSTFPKAILLAQFMKALGVALGPIVAVERSAPQTAALVVTMDQLRASGGTDRMAFFLHLSPAGWAPGDPLSDAANVGLTKFAVLGCDPQFAALRIWQFWNPGAPLPKLTPAALSALRAFLR